MRFNTDNSSWNSSAFRITKLSLNIKKTQSHAGLMEEYNDSYNDTINKHIQLPVIKIYTKNSYSRNSN